MASRVLQTGKNQITQKYKTTHKAVDLVKYQSSLDYIIAHSAGTVVFCQTGHKNNILSVGNASYGNCVKIDHGNGYYTLYAHLSSVSVKYGDTVKKGQVIGYMGATGRSFGAHLHFEVQKDGVRIDPTPYLEKDFPKKDTPDVELRVYANGNWLPWVKNNNDYAGNFGQAVTGVQCGLSKGSIKYRVGTLGGNYLPWVTNHGGGADGYAGIKGKSIDRLQMTCTDKNYKAVYRVHLLGGGWLDWVTNYGSGANGYAGIKGKSIDAIEVKIEKK